MGSRVDSQPPKGRFWKFSNPRNELRVYGFRVSLNPEESGFKKRVGGRTPGVAVKGRVDFSSPGPGDASVGCFD